MTLPYTLDIVDADSLIGGTAEGKIEAAAEYIMSLLARYMTWEGEFDIEVHIRPDSESTSPGQNGSMKCEVQQRFDGIQNAWINEALEECLTGIDNDTNAPDAKITIYLAEDDSLRIDGLPLWFDPDPQFDVTAPVPIGEADFIGIFTHEIFHALGFYSGTFQFDQNLTSNRGSSLL